MNLRLASLTVMMTAAFAAPASAHHSFAMYEANRTTTLQGTVKQFEWVNPHCWLRVMATDERTGKPALWTFEMGAPSQLSATGIYANSFKPGDVVSVTFLPRMDGSRTGLLVRGALAR
jgi:hypothetical protein